jgi:hypothetical protein
VKGRYGLRKPAMLLTAFAFLWMSAATFPANADRTTVGTLSGAPGAEVELLSNGLYRVTLRDGYTFTTHGPDPTPPELGPNIAQIGPHRDPVCADDEHYQHVLYGHPAIIEPSRFEEVKDDIRDQIRSMNALLNEAALESGDTTADYKVLCDETGEIQVDEFTNSTLLPYFSFVVDAARGAGFNDPQVDYTIFYDGEMPGICGQGTFAADDRPTPNNRNNSGGYGVTYVNCWFSRTPMHENGHNQGAVQDEAPDEDDTNHCNDQIDVMCYPVSTTICPDVMRYDCDYDSYFDAQPESGEWLDDHWNIGSRHNYYIAFGDMPSELIDPDAGLEFSNKTPERGQALTATLFLGECEGLGGTTVELQYKAKSFRTLKKATLDDECTAEVTLKANFDERTFRSFWLSQDELYLSSTSRAVRITTR